MAETATATEVNSGVDAAAKYRTVRGLCSISATGLCPALGCSAWSLSFGSAPCSGTMIRPPRLMRGRAQVYFNGRMVPEHEARVSIFDSALMFGDMVSRT